MKRVSISVTSNVIVDFNGIDNRQKCDYEYVAIDNESNDSYILGCQPIVEVGDECDLFILTSPKILKVGNKLVIMPTIKELEDYVDSGKVEETRGSFNDIKIYHNK